MIVAYYISLFVALNVLAGWLYARVRQNGDTINEWSEKKFVENWVIGPIVFWCSALLVFLLIALVAEAFRHSTVIEMVIDVVSLVTRMVIIFLSFLFIYGTASYLAPKVMRKNK